MTVQGSRGALVRRALVVEQLSIAWMIVEGTASLAAGLLAHSVALVAFGADSVLELIAGAALFGRLRAELRDADVEDAERRERKALCVVGVTLSLLCAYIVVDAAFTFWKRSPPDKSPLGLAVAGAALVLMPFLARAKMRLGRQLESSALIADGKETIACAWLSGAVLLGVGLNAIGGWWWADPVAALAMVPFLAREAREALEEARGGEGCADCHADGD